MMILVLLGSFKVHDYSIRVINCSIRVPQSNKYCLCKVRRVSWVPLLFSHMTTSEYYQDLHTKIMDLLFKNAVSEPPDCLAYGHGHVCKYVIAAEVKDICNIFSISLH